MTKSRGIKAPPYSLLEDRAILSHPEMTEADRERLLRGRSSASVRQRRLHLRRMGYTLETIDAYHRSDPPLERPPLPFRRDLSSEDELSWIIVNEMDQQTRTWSQLARDLGRTRATVAKRRDYILRMGGWHCPLSRERCRICGEVVIARKWGPSVTLHPGCEREYKRQHDMRDYIEQVNEETRDAASQHRTYWTNDEDQYLIDHLGDRDEDVAYALGRTLHAIQNRTQKLRRWERIA